MPSAVVNATSANLRAVPSPEATIEAVLVQGQSVDLISSSDDNSWLLVSALVEGTTRIGWIRADLVSVGGTSPLVEPPDHGGPDGGAGLNPVGPSVPFKTEGSKSFKKGAGQSETSGLVGTEQKFDDGSVVIEATENLSATRADGLDATLTASCRRVTKGNIMTVEQRNYSYKHRELPLSTVFLSSQGIPSDVPDGFQATARRDVIASQFGKVDHMDEGTGSPVMGLVQTNSEVFGASIKVSKMQQFFGDNWRNNPRRMSALIEVHSDKTHRRVRVPLVDVGPREDLDAEVDLSFACDQFLGTKGQGPVSYRLLIPV